MDSGTTVKWDVSTAAGPQNFWKRYAKKDLTILKFLINYVNNMTKVYPMELWVR